MNKDSQEVTVTKVVTPVKLEEVDEWGFTEIKTRKWEEPKGQKVFKIHKWGEPEVKARERYWPTK